jgi:hypothetical protein
MVSIFFIDRPSLSNETPAATATRSGTFNSTIFTFYKTSIIGEYAALVQVSLDKEGRSIKKMDTITFDFFA